MNISPLDVKDLLDECATVLEFALRSYDESIVKTVVGRHDTATVQTSWEFRGSLMANINVLVELSENDSDHIAYITDANLWRDSETRRQWLQCASTSIKLPVDGKPGQRKRQLGDLLTGMIDSVNDAEKEFESRAKDVSIQPLPKQRDLSTASNR
ncbi:MAG: hypothetical protein O3A46_03940 [Candidatus Poribacteria bacterium]|nr:hypothetical protein [Candidatus Poribacteria bacterium]